MNPHEEEQLYTELRLLSDQIKQMQHHLTTLNRQLVDLAQLTETLEGIQSLNKKDTMLVPLGSGIFVEAEIKNVQEVVMGVGANVSVKKPISGAKQIVESQTGEIRGLIAQLESEMQRASAHYNEVQHHLRSVMQHKPK